jgi:prophage regulatory protein
MKTETVQTDRLLRIGEVSEMVGIKRSTIYAKIAEGVFPPPVRLEGSSTSLWRLSTIQNVVAKAR